MIQNDASKFGPSVVTSENIAVPLAEHKATYRLLDVAWQTFLSDLPQLLLEHADKFVAYQGSVRIGLDDSPWELDRLVATLPPGTAAVYQIQPVGDVDLDGEVGPLL